MEPVRTNGSNFVYRGPTPDVGDAWVQRKPHEGVVLMAWRPTSEEAEAIAQGALIELGIFGMEPIPPVSLAVSVATELSARGAELRDRAVRALAASRRSRAYGYWQVSSDVWAELQQERALDPSTGGVPTLYGLPLMELTHHEAADTLMLFEAEPPAEGLVQ